MTAFGEKLANANEQLKILNQPAGLPKFEEKFKETGEERLSAAGLEILQVNIGRLCNQVCKHCHVDAGPDRTEIMTKETMQLCLDALSKSKIQIVDITGGAPEMNPDFKWFISELSKLKMHIMVRSNLTILVSNGFNEYPRFLADNEVEIISSLPYYTASNTDRQRGEGVFDKSIQAIRVLNELGYGKENSGLIFNLVYNPIGAFLPPKQESLEKDYKRELWNRFGLVFNNLYTITNLPISRFLDYLIESENYLNYMNRLIQAFNPAAALNVMCRNTISVGWDGQLYDCDFNQMLKLPLSDNVPKHIIDFDPNYLANRLIVTCQHCYGCTAGAGSSCGGSTV